MVSVNRIARRNTAVTGYAIGGRGAVVLLAAALAVALCLTGCGSSQGSGAGAKVEQKAFPLLFQIDEDAAP